MERAVLLFFILALCYSGVRVVAAVSVEASFNDPRCEDERVCQNDPLLFTCTVTGSDADLVIVRLPSEERVNILSDNTTSFGGGDLPDGVRVHSYNAMGGGLVDYTLTLEIDRASILNDNNVVCSDGPSGPETDEASCPVASAPQEPVNVRQMNSNNTESSVLVLWQAPEETGGVSISTYTVTVDGDGRIMSQNISGNMLTYNITGLEYNTDYEVNVTAINSCGIPSEPATITVFIDARAPPQPSSPEVMMNCSVAVSAGRTVVISWMEGDRVMNVVYPETEDVIVTLTPGDIVCQNETYTNCSATITSEDNYTASITVSNDVGSSTLVTTSFSSSILYAEADLNPANPRVTAVVNTSLCINNVNMFQVNFLFGVVDSGNCVPAPTNSRNVSFNTTRTAFSPPPTLNAGDIYCFALSLSIGGVSVAEVNGSGVVVAPTGPSGTPRPAAIAGGVGGSVVLILCIVVVVVVLIVCVIKKKKGLKKKSSERDQNPDTIQRTAHPETGEMYTMVDLKKRNRELEQVGATALYQDPSTIQHEEGPSGDVYAMPQKTGKKKKKEAEAEVEEMSEDQKAALYSVPDRKGQKSKSEGLEYAQLDIQPSVKQAPPSKGSTYVDIRY